jgi:hypothetical protein
VQHADEVHIADVANSKVIQEILLEYSSKLLPFDFNPSNRLVA